MNADVTLEIPSPTRILLIEDNEVSSQLIRDYLEYWGCQVCCLSSGIAFADTMQSFQPHLILLDIKLPEIDGYQLLQQMQTVPVWFATPVIVVSAFAFDHDRQRALSLGARRYLVKPVKLALLKQAIVEELAQVAN